MPDDNSINGDLAARAVVDTSRMDWSPSPSGTVWRKRVHRVGPPESGQVTSVVRYEPEASFPAHDHPEGEEILVLDGVFSDEHGDWPAGTYLLNPEGFRHSPFSRAGCTLFVKLRQFPGLDREHHVIDTNARDWIPSRDAGVSEQHLYAQDGFSDAMSLERWSAEANPGTRRYPGGVEYFVIDGSFADASGTYGAGTWLRLPAGAKHTPRTTEGCTVYVKRDSLIYLRPGVG